MKQPPGLQLLHCVKSAGSGGESIFSDALQAAADLDGLAPDLFGTLMNMKVTYHYTKGGHDFQDTKPVFEMYGKNAVRSMLFR